MLPANLFGKKVTVGVFSEELSAARARDAAVLALMGPHEQMNWEVEEYSWEEVELAGRLMGERLDWEEQQQGQQERAQGQEQEQGQGEERQPEQQQEHEQVPADEAPAKARGRPRKAAAPSVGMGIGFAKDDVPGPPPAPAAAAAGAGHPAGSGEAAAEPEAEAPARKRGRPRKAAAPAADAAADALGAVAGVKGAGDDVQGGSDSPMPQSPAATAAVTAGIAAVFAEAAALLEAEAPAKKRGRPRKVSALAVDAAADTLGAVIGGSSVELPAAATGGLAAVPVDAAASEISEAPAAKKRGRPRKAGMSAEPAAAAVAAETLGLMKESAQGSGLGVPPAGPAEASEEEAADKQADAPVKRKRGRPPKASAAAADVSQEPDQSQPSKRRRVEQVDAVGSGASTEEAAADQLPSRQLRHRAAAASTAVGVKKPGAAAAAAAAGGGSGVVGAEDVARRAPAGKARAAGRAREEQGASAPATGALVKKQDVEYQQARGTGNKQQRADVGVAAGKLDAGSGEGVAKQQKARAVKGVHWRPDKSRWAVRFEIRGNRHYIG